MKMLRDTESWQDHMISIYAVIIYLDSSISNKANLLPNVLASTQPTKTTLWRFS